MPKISVIVPVYNVEKYIRRCLDSILAQTFTDFELILVDDGSPDNCGKICDEYVEKDNRIIVIHQKNGGLSAARNAGIDWAFANSKSEWLSFIDSDDWVDCDYLSVLYDAVNYKKGDISICSYLETDSDNTPDIQKSNYSFNEFDTENFYCTHLVNATVAWGKLYKKNLFKKVRYPAGIIHEDEFVTYKLLFSCKTITFVDLPLYFYYVNPTGITKSQWTPDRLAKIDALMEQQKFFREKNYMDARRKCIMSNLKAIQESILELKNAELENKEYYNAYIRKNLRYILRQDKTELSIRKRPDLYFQAYPFLAKLYGTAHGFIKKFKR